MNRKRLPKNNHAPEGKNYLSPRALAWQCLCQWQINKGTFADTLIRRCEDKLSHADRNMLQAIVLGTLRHLRRLEHILKTLRGNKHVEDDARWLLLSGLCQLIILEWSDYAVVNESVGLAPRRLKPVVNAVLREALRRRDQWTNELASLPLGIRYSMPDWLVDRWLARFGERETCQLLEHFNQPAVTFLRVNPLNPPTNIPSHWYPLPNLDGWFRLGDGPLPLAELRAGQVYATDPATRHSIALLAPAPGEKILDTCAAPGGKSAAILSATGGQCRLLSTDADPSRLSMLRSNLKKACPAQSFSTELIDWSLPCPAHLRSSFDAVLVDVPCSNTGVLQRRVDVRWRLSPAELQNLVALQLKILRHAMQAVRPGGRLVYSTCSIEPEENTDLIRRILSEFPDYHIIRESLSLPHITNTDGAYAALISS